ncbi:protein arginine N-methyltransferase 9-like isoform X2 [Amphiura filiformis]|uniref:protein arginine N-methyltransferase 9-like isoform X2 n=1 Tax=Amphiura filiformis TaxID=82378 RepID=UPI003B2259E6
MDNNAENRAKFAEEIHSRAKACLTSNDYGHACANYLMLLKLSAEFKTTVKEEFAIALDEWVMQLDQRGKTKDAFWCFEQALELWPDNDMLLHSMGAFLFKLGFPDEAASYIRKALDINPDNPGAKDSLQSIANSVVERWHFRMLNDVTRNTCYLSAVQKAVGMGHDTVLDIGSGTGLLSMFAVQSGAKSVHACEMSKTMYEMSHDVLTANQMEDKISIYHKKSSALKVPGDLPNRVSLVVTETVDAGLLGEHILETLHHAWESLLLPPPRGRVIPAGATVYGQVIECQHLRKRHRLLSNTVGNLDLHNTEFISKAVCMEQTHLDDTDFEPYTSEKLCALPGGYKTLTPVFKVMHFDFNNPMQLYELQTSKHQSFISSIVDCSGQIDAIVTWFDLALDDHQSLSTAPGYDSCWEQAIYPVHTSQLKDSSQNPLSVKEDDTITVAISCANNHLGLMCCKISHNASHSHVKGHDVDMKKSIALVNNISRENDSQNVSLSGADGFVDLDKMDLSSSGQSCTKSEGTTNVVFLEEHDVALLNDSKTQFALLNAIKSTIMRLKPSSIQASMNKDETESYERKNFVSDQLKKTEEKTAVTISSSISTDQSSDPSNKLSVLDLSQVLSVAGLYAAKLNDTTNVCITQPNRNVQHALQCIAKNNGLDIESNFKFVSKSDVLHPNADALWDLVIVDVVEPTGALRQQVLEDIAVARTFCLKPNGVVLPGEITIFGVCVESSNLLSDSRVLGDDRTMGLNIAKYINVFKVSTQLDLTLSTLAYKQLSLPFLMFHLNFNQPCQEADGTIPSHLNQSKSISVEITQDGRLVAIPYWFDISMDKDHHVNSMDKETHWKQAAFLLEEPVEVKKGQKVVVIATLKGSSIWFDIKR